MTTSLFSSERKTVKSKATPSIKIVRDSSSQAKGRGWVIRAIKPELQACVDKIEEFLQALVRRGLSMDSVRSYAYDLIVIHRWLEQDRLAVDDLHGKDQFRFIEYQSEHDHARASINRRLVTLRSFYLFCTGNELEHVGKGISAPPGHYRGGGKEFLGLVSRSRKPKVQLKLREEKKLILPLRPEEVNQFLKGLRNYRDLAIAALMLFCGLRSTEVRLLELSSIGFERRELRVRGKGAKERLVPLPENVIRLIQGYLKWERPSEAQTTVLFLVSKGATQGNPITAAGFRSFYRYRRKCSGITHGNPHRFRHTFGTNLARSGVNLRVLQELLGHAPGSPVTQRYLHLALGDVADAFYAVHRGLEKQYAQLG